MALIMKKKMPCKVLDSTFSGGNLDAVFPVPVKNKVYILYLLVDSAKSATVPRFDQTIVKNIALPAVESCSIKPGTVISKVVLWTDFALGCHVSPLS